MIRTYEVQFVPCLLQTEAYARAVAVSCHPSASEDQIERRVELRMKRQRILYDARPASLWAVIDEAALRRQVGGPATMRAQLEHLIDLSARQNITIQVLPFRAGAHAAAGGPITLARLPEAELPDVVYLEQLASALYPHKPADIDFYWDVMNRLVIAAEPPIATTAILDRVVKES